MDFIKLCVVFAVIIMILWMKKPLFWAILGGTIGAVLLYGITLWDTMRLSLGAITGKETLTVVSSFYLVTFLQRMLEERRRLKGAQEALNGLFRNRRINAALAPAVIGLLPSAGAISICATMVDSACGDYLVAEDKTFITSFYRHIPESFLPTFSSILIGVTLSNVGIGTFVLAMMPMIVVLFILGHMFYIRKLPKQVDKGNQGTPDSRRTELKKLARSLWSIVMVVVLIISLNLPVYVVTPIVICVNLMVDRFRATEILPMFRTAFEPVIICNTILIMVFKDIITSTGVVHQLPELFSRLPISIFLVFVLIFFVGTIISGSNAIIALCMPMAMAAVPNAGLPLVVALMCSCYSAMQISPTHICLFVAAEHFKVPIGSLIRRTIPIIGCFLVISFGYSMVLQALFY